MELKNRIAIVTGAGRGIGRALACEFAHQGASVVCTARTAPQIEETARLITDQGGTALAVAGDITQPDDVTRIVGTVRARFDRIDVLFNNAGSFSAIGALWEVDPDVWWRDVQVNLRGPMLMSRAVLDVMIEQDKGIIINMNGGGSTTPLCGGSAYGASKAALLRLTDTMAAELERIGSKVLVVAMGPGFVKTEMTMLQAGPAGQKWIPGAKKALDEGRHRPPEDCAQATVKLLRVMCPEFNGRVFGMGLDLDDLARRARQIKQEDRLMMRFRPDHAKS